MEKRLVGLAMDIDTTYFVSLLSDVNYDLYNNYFYQGFNGLKNVAFLNTEIVELLLNKCHF